MSEPDGLRRYARRVWTVVALRMLIDLAAALFILAVVGLLAAGLVALAGSGLRVNLQHVRRASAIVGCVYVLVIWVRTLRRHWIIAGHVMDETPAAKPQATEVSDAHPVSSSS